MSATLSLLVLLHMAVAFVFVGIFVSLMCFSGAPSNRSKAASESRVRRCSDRVARSRNAGSIQRSCLGNSSVTLLRSVELVALTFERFACSLLQF